MTNPITVLSADNNPTFMRVTMRNLLQPDDITFNDSPDEVGKGEVEAQKVIPQVVLIDLAMPELFGFEVLPRLQVTHSEIKAIDISRPGAVPSSSVGSRC